jgi:ribosome-associated translation inhibitor RaiA
MTTTELIVQFHGLAPSPAIEAEVTRRYQHLLRISDRIVRARVTLEARHHRHRQGNVYHVNVSLLVPGGEILVNREPERDHAHEDIYVAIRDSFRAAERQLKNHTQVLRGDIKRKGAERVPPEA